MKIHQLQHGDVCIEAAKIPDVAKRREGDMILAEGDVTGHAHRVSCPEGVEAELLELGDKLFLRIIGGDASVVHEEHKEITIPAGEYEISRVQEFDHFAQEARTVAD